MERLKYYTIAEFSELTKVSRQTIYNHLNGKLKEHHKRINGVIVILQSAIDLYIDKIDNEIEKPLQELDKNQVKFENELIALLKSQIEEKNKEIERLHEEIKIIRHQAEADKIKFNENQNRMMDIVQQAQQLNHNNQVLLREQSEKKINIFKRLFAPKETNNI